MCKLLNMSTFNWKLFSFHNVLNSIQNKVKQQKNTGSNLRVNLESPAAQDVARDV